MASEALHIPETVEDLLSPLWVTDALQERFPGTTVLDVTVGPVVARVATNARFTVTYADGSAPDAPKHLCAKAYLSETGRAVRQAGIPEALFYRHLAKRSSIRTPECVYAAVDLSTAANVVITEDVVAQGARFVDCFSRYSPDDVAAGLEQLAGLHASTWMNADLASMPWLDSRFELYLVGRGLDVIVDNFAGAVGAQVPESVRDARKLVSGYRRVAQEAPSASPWSVIHGDPHISNVYLDALGRPNFVDWQLVQRGSPFVDVGYHLASALPTDLRRAHEVDLVDHYLDALLARGIDLPAAEHIWHGVRSGFIHGFYLWAITIQVTPSITTELLARLGNAVADHQALDLP